MNKGFLLLGATGSVGKSVLEALDMLHLPLIGFSFHENEEKALEIIQKYSPRFVIATGNQEYHKIKKTGITFWEGIEKIEEGITFPGVDCVINALSGIAGIKPSFDTLQAGKKLILANKESIVMGGNILLSQTKYEDQILPIDSEHWSLFSLLRHIKKNSIQSLILTASGGPFKDYTLQQLAEVSKEEALRHPVWSMGAKISISSATLANKGLEVLEASCLFDFPVSQIQVLIHPEAKIHGLIQMQDGSFFAHISETSMVYPIRSALCYPDWYQEKEQVFFPTTGCWNFEKPDYEKFPLLALAYEVGKKNLSYQIAYTVANDYAVECFLEGKIKFLQIATIVQKTIQNYPGEKIESLRDILKAIQNIRDFTQKIEKEILCSQ